MVLKRLTSFPIFALTRTCVHVRFLIPHENSAVHFKWYSDLKWEIASAIYRAVLGEACNGGVQLCIVDYYLEVRQSEDIYTYVYHMSREISR